MNNLASNPIEDELNVTRIRLYEQTKDMTTEDRVSFLNQKAKDVLAYCGIDTTMIESAIYKQ
jgi:hypothetical protein